MSISVYSACSDEAEQLSSHGYRLYVDASGGQSDSAEGDGCDLDENPVPANKNQMMFMFETPDGSEPLFNHICNKSEVDALIEGGISSDLLKRICLSAINGNLHQLHIYNALKYDEVANNLELLQKNAERASNLIYELFCWDNESLYSIHTAFLWLKAELSNINSCHCNDPGGLHDQLLYLNDEFEQFRYDTEDQFDYIRMELAGQVEDTTTIIGQLSTHNTQLLSPLMFVVSNLFKGNAFDLFTTLFRREYALPNKSDVPADETTHAMCLHS